MQIQPRIKNKTTLWSALLKPRVGDVVKDGETYFSNISGINAVTSDNNHWFPAPGSNSQTLTRLSTTANPIVINNWQTTYGPALGNRPSIAICQKITDDGNGNPAETDRNDLRAIRYYSDSPANTVLTSISIDTGDGSTLSTDYVIKLSK